MSASELKYFDIIEQYVDGNMTEAERENFEQNLASDELLKIEYALYTQIVESVGEYFMAKHKNKLRTIDLELDLENASTPKSRRIILFSIAASLVILLVSYFAISPLFNQPDLKAIASNYDEVDKGIPVLMSMNGDSQFSKAMNQYKQKDYQGSLSILQQLSNDKKNNDTLIYYIGINYQMLDSLQMAINYFKKAENFQYSIFKDKADFRLAICYLKLENKEDALAVLKSIGGNSKHLYQEKALKMLGELE